VGNFKLGDGRVASDGGWHLREGQPEEGLFILLHNEERSRFWKYGGGSETCEEKESAVHVIHSSIRCIWPIKPAPPHDRPTAFVRPPPPFARNIGDPVDLSIGVSRGMGQHRFRKRVILSQLGRDGDGNCWNLERTFEASVSVNDSVESEFGKGLSRPCLDDNGDSQISHKKPLILFSSQQPT